MNYSEMFEIAKGLRKDYPEGTDVVLVSMDNPMRPIPKGTTGKVKSVDDTGTIHVNWANGSSLGVLYGIDKVDKA